METSPELPLQYDPDRMKRFGRRALAKSNFPRDLIPNSVDAAFVDALLGKYYDNALAGDADKIDDQVDMFEFALEMLQGADPEEAKARYSHLSFIKRRGPLEGYLKVAGDAARMYRDELKQDTLIDTEIDISTLEDFTTAPNAIGTRDVVVNLFHDGLIKDAGKAKALLVLLGEPVASKSLERRTIVQAAAGELNYVMARRPSGQTERSEYETNAALQQGKVYLRTLIKGVLDDNLPTEIGVDLVVNTFMQNAGKRAASINRVSLYRHVESHMAYAIDIMYRSAS